jgi:ABC-type glutathione transport system ATPase component
VTTSPDAKDLTTLCEVPSESYVVAIAGESGSGKTLFTTKTLKNAFQRCNYKCLFHSLEDKDAVSKEEDDVEPTIKVAMARMFNFLYPEKKQSPVNDLLTYITSKLNENRATYARKKVQQHVG